MSFLKENEHYHYLVAFQLRDGISVQIFILKDKISTQDIVQFQNDYKTAQKLKYTPVIFNFKRLRCDCEE